jgi:hypothetical protein
MKNIRSILIVLLLISLYGKDIQAFELGDINVHGFISQGYLQTSENDFMAETKDGTLEFNEMGMNFSTELTNRLHLGVQFFAYDLGDVGNDELRFDWAYANYHWRRELGFRVGTVKLVSGLYNEQRQLDMLRTGVFLPFGVYTGPWWESFSSLKGLTLYGELPIGEFGEILYNAQAGVCRFTEESGPAKVAEYKFSPLDFAVSDVDSEYSYVLSLEWSLPSHNLRTKATVLQIEGLRFHGNISVPFAAEAGTETSLATIPSTMDLDVMELHSSVFSLEYRWEELLLAAEYNLITSKTQFDLHLGAGWEGERTITSEGLYLSASYRFTDWFELGCWYSEFYPDKDDKEGKKQSVNDFEAWQKTVALSARFDINEYWIVKLEASYNDGFGAYNIADKPENLKQEWFLYSAKVTYNF